jgi:hypothetical protein
MDTTQANAPAPAQAPQPVHPIIQEQQIVDRLTKYVKETPDNDPHHPENSSAPQPAETQPETPVEAPAEEVVEFDEETPFFELDYNGEKKKLSAKDLREGYLAKQDYHRNIQKVKAQEAELGTKAQQAELRAAQEYAQRLEVHKQAVTRLSGVKTMPEIEALSRQDPAAAQQEFLKLISVNQTIQAIEGEQRAAAEKHQQAMKAAHAQTVAKAREILESDVPNWSAELYSKVLGGVAKDYGFQNHEVEPVVDPRLIKVFHDAYQYRQLQRAKPEISKKVVTVPKVMKPGSAEKPNPSSDAVQDAEKRLKKSGDLRDAAALYLARQKQKK